MRSFDWRNTNEVRSPTPNDVFGDPLGQYGQFGLRVDLVNVVSLVRVVHLINVVNLVIVVNLVLGVDLVGACLDTVALGDRTV